MDRVIQQILKIDRHDTTIIQHKKNSLNYKINIKHKAQIKFIFQQPSRCVQEYSGHSSAIMSLDFHPKKTEVFCFCDGENEIRYWNINSATCTRVTKVR